MHLSDALQLRCNHNYLTVDDTTRGCICSMHYNFVAANSTNCSHWRNTVASIRCTARLAKNVEALRPPHARMDTLIIPKKCPQKTICFLHSEKAMGKMCHKYSTKIAPLAEKCPYVSRSRLNRIVGDILPLSPLFVMKERQGIGRGRSRKVLKNSR